MNEPKLALPTVLDEALRPIARLHPTELSVTLNLRPPSRAAMRLPPGERVALHTLVALETPQSAGIFRVTGVDEIPGEGMDVTLRHTLSTLSDDLMPGTGSLTGPVRQVLETLLAHQTGPHRWTLGDVETTEGQTLSCTYSNSNLLTALLNILDELPDMYLEPEQSGNVWRVHLRAMRPDDACECRLTRNLQSLTVSVDDSELCTRVYMRGLAQPEDAPSIADWGVVSRYLTANRRLKPEAMRTLARQYLDSHSEPGVTVSLDAMDLHRVTGETLDSFPLGRICRVALPEQSTVIRQRVTSITYPDVYGDPTRARVTLANQQADTADVVSGLMAHVSVVYQGLEAVDGVLTLQAEQIELLAQQIELNAEQITLNAEQIELHAEQIALKADSVTVDGLTTRINAAEVSIDGLNGRIDLCATHTELTEGLSSLQNSVSIALDALNARIDLCASRQEVDALGTRLSNAEIVINGAEGTIGLTTLVANLTDDLAGVKQDYETLAGLVDELGEQVSDAGIRISAAEASIKEWARRTQVVEDSQGNLEKRVTQAELDIDGANAAIALKADSSVVGALGTRLTSAELTIDGLNGEIQSKVTKSEFDKLGSRVTTAESSITQLSNQITSKVDSKTVSTMIDQKTDSISSTVTSLSGNVSGIYQWIDDWGSPTVNLAVRKGDLINQINLSEEGIIIKANRIDLSGCVTATELAAELAEIETQFSDYLSAETINCGSVECTGLYAEDGVLSHAWIDGNEVTWKSLTFTTGSIQYLDWDGMPQTARLIKPTSSATIHYLSY